MTFKPYTNIVLRKKNVNFIMNPHKLGCDYKELVKINYKSSLLIRCWFPYGTCSQMTLLDKAKFK